MSLSRYQQILDEAQNLTVLQAIEKMGSFCEFSKPEVDTILDKSFRHSRHIGKNACNMAKVSPLMCATVFIHSKRRSSTSASKSGCSCQLKSP